MNDLSSDFDGDAERDRRIVDWRVGGKSVADLCAMLGVTVADVNRALDRAAQAALKPAARVRVIHVDQAQLESLEEAFLPAAKGGDDKAAMVVIRAQERKATSLGLNAPSRIDPIQLAEAAGPQMNSTEKIRAVFDRLMAEDRQALCNGGPGYGDWRDDRDREEMARCEQERQREKADDE